MSTQENKTIARNHYLNTQNLEATFKYASPQVVFNALPGLPPTYEGWKQGHGMFLEAVPDQKLTIEDEIADGDTVVTRWTFTGTHRGPLMGIPATGKSITIKGISVDRIRAGQVVEHSALMDMLGRLQQIGAGAPAPQAA